MYLFGNLKAWMLQTGLRSWTEATVPMTNHRVMEQHQSRIKGQPCFRTSLRGFPLSRHARHLAGSTSSSPFPRPPQPPPARPRTEVLSARSQPSWRGAHHLQEGADLGGPPSTATHTGSHYSCASVKPTLAHPFLNAPAAPCFPLSTALPAGSQGSLAPAAWQQPHGSTTGTPLLGLSLPPYWK